MTEPWKHEPLTITPEQRIAALRAISSARTNVRTLAMAESEAVARSKAGAIDRRLLELQRFLEGKKRNGATRSAFY